MQPWGVRPVPDEERLDLSHYPEEFVECCWFGDSVPAAAVLAADECPHSPGELQTMRAEQGGRTLSEIWKSLGAK